MVNHDHRLPANRRQGLELRARPARRRAVVHALIDLGDSKSVVGYQTCLPLPHAGGPLLRKRALHIFLACVDTGVIGRLPGLSHHIQIPTLRQKMCKAPSSREAARKTGTDSVAVLASCLALSSVPKGALVDSNGLTGKENVQCKKPGKAVIPKVSSERRRGDRVADRAGLESVRTTSAYFSFSPRTPFSSSTLRRIPRCRYCRRNRRNRGSVGLKGVMKGVTVSAPRRS